mmetsp:Transcript_24375/g.47867  ORF Transcript_24375/g.47867 Transcript_24375/m.47867 type:complete len:287 (+) Transcript_24375:755-1615(+)
MSSSAMKDRDGGQTVTSFLLSRSLEVRTSCEDGGIRGLADDCVNELLHKARLLVFSEEHSHDPLWKVMETLLGSVGVVSEFLAVDMQLAEEGDEQLVRCDHPLAWEGAPVGSRCVVDFIRAVFLAGETEVPNLLGNPDLGSGDVVSEELLSVELHDNLVAIFVLPILLGDGEADFHSKHFVGRGVLPTLLGDIIEGHVTHDKIICPGKNCNDVQKSMVLVEFQKVISALFGMVPGVKPGLVRRAQVGLRQGTSDSTSTEKHSRTREESPACGGDRPLYSGGAHSEA